MPKHISREDAAKLIVGVLTDYDLSITEAEALRVIDLFEAFQSRYKVEIQEAFQNTGCTAQALPGTNGGFTTAVFTGAAVPEGTALFIKKGE